MVGLLDWELWSQACHVAFTCQALVVVYGQDVTGWGRELYGQVRGGDDCAKCIEGRTAQEDVVRCWRIDNKEADWEGFGLGSVPKGKGVFFWQKRWSLRLRSHQRLC